MKKIFVTIVVACLALSAWAVELPKQGFGVQVGWAQPILRLNDPANPSTAKDSLSNVVKMKGFKVGVVYDGSFIAGFGTSIGLNYTFGAYNSGWKKDRNNYYGSCTRETGKSSPTTNSNCTWTGSISLRLPKRPTSSSIPVLPSNADSDLRCGMTTRRMKERTMFPGISMAMMPLMQIRHSDALTSPGAWVPDSSTNAISCAADMTSVL